MTPLRHMYGYSSQIFVDLPKRTEPYPLLGTLAEMHESFRQLQDQIEKLSDNNSPDVFAGIAAGVGTIIEKAGEGTSKIITALGSSIKSVAQGVGGMSKDIISTSGDALAETITAGGNAISNVEEGGADILNSIFGGIPGILGMLSLLIIVLVTSYLLYKRYQKKQDKKPSAPTGSPIKEYEPTAEELMPPPLYPKITDVHDQAPRSPTMNSQMIYELIHDKSFLQEVATKLGKGTEL